MTVKRYSINYVGIINRDVEAPGMNEHPYGAWVRHDDAKRDIERLGNELFAARAALHAEQKQRAADIKRKDELIEALNKSAHAAVVALGFADPDE
jgi:hypothetical protein